jgi:hypothetical protein
MKRRVRHKRGVSVLANQADAACSRAGADGFRFEQHDRDAGRSETPRGSRTGESTADNDNPDVEMSAKAGKRRPAASGQAIEPERLMPQLHAADPEDEITRAVSLIGGMDRAYSNESFEPNLDRLQPSRLKDLNSADGGRKPVVACSSPKISRRALRGKA